MYKIKTYEELDFTDDFLFCKILELYPELARELLEMILQFPIRKVKVNRQVSIDQIREGRGIRLDVYAEDENNTVYDIEMQTTKQKELPKRTRYYQGMIDLNMIEKGAKFSELKKAYIIFICMSDPFKEGRYVYTFKNLCMENPKLELGDDTTKVFLNASGTVGEISEELRDFFNLLNKRKIKSDFSRKIEAAVKNAKTHKEWRAEYMTLEMHYQEKYEEGLEEGRAEGSVKTLIALVKKGKLTISEAAEEAEMTEKEFEELLKSAED